MFCNQCGKNVDENAKFCNQCGNLMEEVIEAIVKFCNQCGSRTEMGQSFCPKCGNTLKDTIIKSDIKTDIKTASPVRKKKNFLPLIITVGVAMFFLAAVFIGFKLKSNSGPTKAEIPSKKVEKNTLEDSEDRIEDLEEEETILTEDSSKTAEPEEIAGDTYLFPSDRMYIKDEHLDSLTREEIALIRNEVFARHGYIFQKEPYKSYFSSMPWYIPDEDFTDSAFSEIEKANVDAIVIYESKKGWN